MTLVSTFKRFKTEGELNSFFHELDEFIKSLKGSEIDDESLIKKTKHIITASELAFDLMVKIEEALLSAIDRMRHEMERDAEFFQGEHFEKFRKVREKIEKMEDKYKQFKYFDNRLNKALSVLIPPAI